MPKAARAAQRRKTTKIGGAPPQRERTASPTVQVATKDANTPTAAVRRRAVAPRPRPLVAPRPRPLQDLIFPIMVALGCWGMAFTLAFFYTDPNRFLFAGMAALMALLWTYNAVTRIRKALLARQQSM